MKYLTCILLLTLIGCGSEPIAPTPEPTQTTGVETPTPTPTPAPAPTPKRGVCYVQDINGATLLLREYHNGVSSKFDFPGALAADGESETDAAIRGVMELTGLTVQTTVSTLIYDPPESDVTTTVFTCTVTGTLDYSIPNVFDLAYYDPLPTTVGFTYEYVLQVAN